MDPLLHLEFNTIYIIYNMLTHDTFNKSNCHLIKTKMIYIFLGLLIHSKKKNH